MKWYGVVWCWEELSRSAVKWSDGGEYWRKRGQALSVRKKINSIEFIKIILIVIERDMIS